MAQTVSDKTQNRIQSWLWFVMALVVAMIALGGATRLTNSGLSITEWKPITGALPPLSHEQWLVEFEKYKQIPEFAAEHPDMDVSSFKFIYFWEWSHRQLGRLIGLAYGLPFLWFLFRRKLANGQSWRFFAILILIGLQGAIGWWMVASGLVNDRVDVSQYRLATHLGLAFIILAMLYWTWRHQKENWDMRRQMPAGRRHTLLLTICVFVQIIFGAFVAGTHAGKTYNSWPLMDGKVLPEGYAMLSPYWKNFTENIAAIQFNHRTLAYIIAILVLTLVWRARHLTHIRKAAQWAGVLVLVQIGLGIWTLLAVAPLGLSLAHQFLAIFVFLAALGCYRASRFTY